ncbi:MAG: TonB-dependent receptor [Parvularcula sp.]|jgi:iron complex outermembrane receptor protein|nr:TonB-dependent receptor [Parvularcula sp.]
MRYHLLAAASLIAVSAQPAFAQAVNQPTDGDDERGSNVIIVTAQKREQNIQDVPLSITAIGGEDLEASGIVDLSRLEQRVPGLQFGQSGSDARPAIRGARTENISVQQDPVIGFFVDGIYRSRTTQALAAFVDVNRVEVLRGPQGTLYGRNTFGGAINIISNAPSDELGAGANLTIGNFERRRVDGFANAPLTDTLSARVSFAYDVQDGMVENTFNPSEDLKDRDETYVRAQLRWEPSDRFDATIRASLWRMGGNGAGDFGYFTAGTPLNPGGGAFTLDEVLSTTLLPVNQRVGAGLNSPVDPDPFTIARDADFLVDIDQQTLDAEFNYDFGFASAKLLIGYADFAITRTGDGDFSIQPSAFEGQTDLAETFSQELQLTSNGDGPLEWTIGAFHLTDKTQGTFFFDRIFNTDPATNLPLTDTPATGGDFNSFADVDTESWAVFGEATYALTDAFRVTGGLRWTRDDKDFARQTSGVFTVPLVFTGTPFEDSASFEKVTWKAAAEFDVTPDNLLYATVSTGFQSGGFNNSADSVTGGASFDPQTVTAYEIGSKNTFLNGDLIVNLALYQNEFKDLLANEAVAVGTTVLTISTNAGAVTARGAELNVNWRPIDNFSISAFATLNDGEYGTFLATEPITNTAADLDGGRVPFLPDFTGGVGLEYAIDLAGGASITPRADLYYSSSFTTNDFAYDFAVQDAYAKLDLALTYNAAEGNWYAEVWGRNVTDEAVITRTVRFGQNLIGRAFADPATYGVRLGFRY